MKKSLLILSASIFALVFSRAQAQTKADQTRVNEVVVTFFDGLAALDATLIKSQVTSDFLLLEDGAVWTVDTLINKISPLKSVRFKRVNHLTFIQTEIKGNTAWVAYRNIADMTINEQKSGREWLESAFLVKQGANWKIRVLHSTVVKRKAD